MGCEGKRGLGNPKVFGLSSWKARVASSWRPQVGEGCRVWAEAVELEVSAGALPEDWASRPVVRLGDAESRETVRGWRGS